MSHPVVLVDEEGCARGTAEKLRAHTEGWLHRAFSIFVFDARGRLLLQQRNGDKYHSGGLWSNTCCSHPRPGERPLDAAHRRLPEEMGFEAPLRSAFQETYHLPVGKRLVEHEHNHVFVGTVDDPKVQPSVDEVAGWRWVTPSALREDIDGQPHRYTTWFRLLLDPALSAASLESDVPTAPQDRSPDPEGSAA